MGITEGKDICALNCLVKVTEDVVDDDNCLGGIDGASDVFERQSSASRSSQGTKLTLTGLVTANILI